MLQPQGPWLGRQTTVLTAPSPASAQAWWAGAGGNSPIEQVKKQQLAREVGGRLPGASVLPGGRTCSAHPPAPCCTMAWKGPRWGLLAAEGPIPSHSEVNGNWNSVQLCGQARCGPSCQGPQGLGGNRD